MKKPGYILLFPVVMLTMYPGSLSRKNIVFSKTEEGVLLLDDNNPRFFYQTATKSLDGKYPRTNYIHPLWGMNGDTLTEDFPEDHLHHRGIFWTWHQLWSGNKRLADPWFCENIEWRVDSINTLTTNKKAILWAVVTWIIQDNETGEKNTVLTEDVYIEYIPYKNFYELTFSIKLTPLIEDLRLGGSENLKEYGGFSARIELPESPVFYCYKGIVKPESTPVEAGGWVQLQLPGKNTSIILMCQPEAMPGFKGWILREKKSMQNAAFPGTEPISISQKSPLIFKSSILVCSGKMPEKTIYKLYKQFQKK